MRPPSDEPMVPVHSGLGAGAVGAVHPGLELLHEEAPVLLARGPDAAARLVPGRVLLQRAPPPSPLPTMSQGSSRPSATMASSTWLAHQVSNSADSGWAKTFCPSCM